MKYLAIVSPPTIYQDVSVVNNFKGVRLPFALVAWYISSFSKPIELHTRSNTVNLVSLAHTSGWRYLQKIILDWEMTVMDEKTGQSLEYRQLRKHPK